jgi:hypothetical protein
MPNRKEAENFIIEYIGKLIPDSGNTELYKILFAKMSDKEFDTFMSDLESEKVNLCVTAPNFGKSKLEVSRNFKLAKELGHEFFQRVWVPAENGNPTYLTPIPYLVIDMPVKRQAQILSKKISIPEDNNSVDDFTGQPTGKSKGSKISYPETQVLAAIGLNESLVELLKYRGGDEKGFNAMNTVLDRTGSVNMQAIEKYASGVKSTHTLEVFLNCLHISNTLSS